MKRILTVTLTLSVLILLAAPAHSQMSSAKGSAAISDLVLQPATDKTNSWHNLLSSNIKVPQQKELVFDVSLECGLMTDTLVKSKGGKADTSEAEAKVQVRVRLNEILADGSLGPDFYAYPGGKRAVVDENGGPVLDIFGDPVSEDYGVTYCQRKQELMAKFGGILVECEDGSDGSVSDGKITADECTFTEEELQLVLGTLSANAFNFVSADLNQGEYMVTVEYEIKTYGSSQEGSNDAWGAIGMGSMVVDEVRFTK